ncbi:MAG: ribonuclease III [Anaerorhabdus sp.]
MKIIEWLAEKGVQIKDQKLIQQAFMHSSYVNEHRDEENNERLEFMGDAVLQLWISNRIFRIVPKLSEGEMTTFRAQLVCEQSLADCARRLDLNQFLLLGSGEEKTGGRDRDSVVADMFEAFLGALYLDGGVNNVEPILSEAMEERLSNPKQVSIVDYKTKLQEYVQADTRKTVTYEVIGVQGPSNLPQFEVRVMMDSIVLGIGVGQSKKKAEQMAAKDAFDKMVK